MEGLTELLQNNLEIVIPLGIASGFDVVLGWVKKEKSRWPGITLLALRLICTAFAKGFNALAEGLDKAIER